MENRFQFETVREDPLGVLESTAQIAARAAPVQIDPDAVARFAKSMMAAPPPTLDEDALHYVTLPARRFLNYLLLLETLNFCFWDDEPRWRVRWQDQALDGYWALAAALRRGIDRDHTPLWDAEWMAEVTEATLGHLLRGEGNTVPLLKQRTAHVRELGQGLLSRWSGQFAALVSACNGDGPSLVLRIVEQFPSFRDESPAQTTVAEAQSVRFYKRAQICVADLARMLPHHPWGRLRRMDCLTAFADYKVPQVMRKEGILVYDEELAAKVDAQVELLPGCAEEVAIRAATIWGCEWIARELSRLQGGAPVRTAEVDYFLWCAGQDKSGLKPYHRTRTIYY